MRDTGTPKALVEIRDLKMHFPIHSGLLRRRTGAVKAVDGITFDIFEGETLGLVGESGCGKSTAGRAMLRLYEPTSGQAKVSGNNLAWGSEAARDLRQSNDSLAKWVAVLFFIAAAAVLFWLSFQVSWGGVVLIMAALTFFAALIAIGLYFAIRFGVLRLRAKSAGIPMADFAPSQTALRNMRPMMQMVFQDPQASLNPRMTVQAIIQEPLDEHTKLSSAEKQEKVGELMDAVGLNRRFASRYPHAFSGGQRQRIGIARALALNPKFIVCDEPIAALDVSIQAQVVNLLEDLQEKYGLTYLFISHDLSMVRHIATRVAVMYLGRIVELAPREALFDAPQHPYTQALLSAVPEPDPSLSAKVERIILTGDVPSPSNPPKGCNFCTRCPKVMDICRSDEPTYKEVAPGHFAACHLHI